MTVPIDTLYKHSTVYIQPRIALSIAHPYCITQGSLSVSHNSIMSWRGIPGRYKVPPCSQSLSLDGSHRVLVVARSQQRQAMVKAAHHYVTELRYIWIEAESRTIASAKCLQLMRVRN